VGFNGSACELPVTEIPCDPKALTCDNGGKVVGYGTDCTCKCEFPFSGVDCKSTDKTCKVADNGLPCGPNSNTLDYNETSKKCECQCKPDYTGKNCEIGTICKNGFSGKSC